MWNSKVMRFLATAPRKYSAFFNSRVRQQNRSESTTGCAALVELYTYPLYYYDWEHHRLVAGREIGKHGCGLILSNLPALGTSVATFSLWNQDNLAIKIIGSLGAGAVGFIFSEIFWYCGCVFPTEMARHLDTRYKAMDEENRALLSDEENFAPLVLNTSVLIEFDSPEPKKQETRGLSTYDTLSDDGDQPEEVAINDVPEFPLSEEPSRHSPRSH